MKIEKRFTLEFSEAELQVVINALCDRALFREDAESILGQLITATGIRSNDDPVAIPGPDELPQ